jgi:hypothetical protein
LANQLRERGSARKQTVDVKAVASHSKAASVIDAEVFEAGCSVAGHASNVDHQKHQHSYGAIDASLIWLLSQPIGVWLVHVQAQYNTAELIQASSDLKRTRQA